MFKHENVKNRVFSPKTLIRLKKQGGNGGFSGEIGGKTGGFWGEKRGKTGEIGGKWEKREQKEKLKKRIK